VCYELNEARTSMLTVVCRQGAIVCGRRHGRTARRLEEMGLVSVEFEIVWVRQQRLHSVDTAPRCRWTMRPTKHGVDMFRRLNKSDIALHWLTSAGSELSSKVNQIFA
jgi:hypothetical protein